MSQYYNRRPKHTPTEIKQFKLKIARQIHAEFNDNGFYLRISSQPDNSPGKQEQKKQSPTEMDRTPIQGRRNNKKT